MANIHIGSDNITTRSQDSSRLAEFCEIVRNAGHTVTNAGVGDNAIQGHMKTHTGDIMVQIAGGMCPGTFADFEWGTAKKGEWGRDGDGYYHARKYCFPMYTGAWTNYSYYDPKKYKLPKNAWDDSFSNVACLQPIKAKIIGKTWQEISNEFERCTGFVEGKSAKELAEGFLRTLGGKTNTSTGAGNGVGGGSSILDLIKQVCSDWDYQGVELQLNGDTLSVKRTNPKTAKPLTTHEIVNNSVSMTDYDANTPNSHGGVKDQYLIDRFGEILVDEGLEDSDKAQVLQVAQRGHNHSIDLKTVLNSDYNVGNWVSLTLEDLGLVKRNYYISKASYQEDRVQTLTLEPAPPSIYVEVPEAVEDTETTDIDIEEEDI